MLQLERLAIAGRMAATLAHEINNPLESLANLLYLIRDKVRDEEGHALVKAAESAVSLLAETTQRTLDLCRGTQQKAQVLNLSDLTAEILANASLPQHVPLRSSIETGLSVRAISGELRQVIFNLLINAAQFSPVGGAVWVTVQRAAEFAEVRVKDEGPGISEKAQARLFQPFYTTRTVGGTGLGLWLSREMVERVGGTLSFESEPALRPGTEFIIRIPIIEA
jgi:signal transduction histidine kinase